jgi:hypothetical protein
MEVEHWVDLDPFHTSIVNPVLGDEQVLDVELDRHTELLPVRRNYGPGASPSDGRTKSGEESSIVEHDEPCKQPLIFCAYQGF